MRFSIALLLAMLICGATAVNATATSPAGQGCRLDLTPHFNVYANESTDGTRIYTSVLTDGYADFTPSAGCTGQGAVHTPKSSNIVGSTGGLGSGTSGCMSCYLSYENDQSIVPTEATDYEFDYQGQVVCSIFGAFYSIGGRVYLSLHTSYGGLISQSVNGDLITCQYAAACSSGSPTCGASGFTNVVVVGSGCQLYARASWLAVKYSRLQPKPTYCFAVVLKATGPGPCD
jgi:hypothetical protein